MGNGQADALEKAAAMGKDPSLGTILETLHQPATKSLDETVATILPIETTNWRTPLLSFLSGTEKPNDPVALRRIQHRARGYRLIQGALYNTDVCAPLLRCIARPEGANLIQKIHEGLCGNHLVTRTLLQGLYWPTIMSDAEDLVCTCQECQWMGRRSHRPPPPLQPIVPV
ncbi:uncharacterized protein LOC133889406 [Phragmites australis]|uniref:uncharacterized protein LOC133889406 n=1 Tax=Phragmites australis TaxID=29695 RepID=UPI002D785D8C|nr:uncharacterized protein LOC133889406 [Phragmites australis]